MSETLTLLLVLTGAALGVGLLVILNVMIGGWTPMRFQDADVALRYLQRDVLGFEPGADRVVTTDGDGALIAEQAGARLGLVLARGDGAIVRALGPADVRAVERSGARLRLGLRDYTLPGAELTLASESVARDWAERVRQFAGLETVEG